MTRIPKIQLLEYALEGAKMIFGINSGQLTDEEEALLQKHIEELERRIVKATYGIKETK